MSGVSCQLGGCEAWRAAACREASWRWSGPKMRADRSPPGRTLPCRANVQPDPRITRGDMATTFPMSNEVVVKAMNASTVMAALAHSADSWTGLTDSVGVYLQQGRLRCVGVQPSEGRRWGEAATRGLRRQSPVGPAPRAPPCRPQLSSAARILTPARPVFPCSYGFDASVPTGRGQRVVKAEIQPAPEKGKPADPADPWQPLESYPGNIVVVGSDYMLKGGDG